MSTLVAPWFGALSQAGAQKPHRMHSADRIWAETNCYADLWIELLHGLGRDPVPAFACVLASDYDGAQWTFTKPATEDLRRLYGIEVAEEALWRPVLDTVLSGPSRQVLHTVEVDSFYLPDTAGTAYRTGHVKTTIVPVRVNRGERAMTYLHNSGRYEMTGEDFDGVFDFSALLPPYVERIGFNPSWIEPGALLHCVRGHLARRPDVNPAARLAEDVAAVQDWLPGAGMDVFHQWSFAVLRQCGAAAELAADLCETLEPTCPGAAAGAEPLRVAAGAAKTVQFKLARLAAGRTVSIGASLTGLAENWQRGIDRVAAAVGAAC